jgi:hypothetical protein
MKPRRFFFHFNKPLSKQRKGVVWSVHYKNQCMFVNNIICNVPCESKTNRRQPYAVIRGMANDITIVENTAIIS